MMSPPDQSPPASARSLRLLALSILLVAAASGAGQLGTSAALVEWYPTIRKPSFTPPNVVFPIVWPLLYALMAFAFWRILRLAPDAPGRRVAIALFVVQLALNAAWSWAFFAMRSPALGMAVILPLEAAIILTALKFWRLDAAAGLALVPYGAWVAFAAALNLGFLALN